MKKAELEEHRDAYCAQMEKAATAQSEGMYKAAMDAAIGAWPYIDGMMQYERKFQEREFTSVEAIDLVLRYAPLLLDVKPLNRLEGLLAERKRIERDTSEDIAGLLGRARERIEANYRLWSYLEYHPNTRQDELREIMGGDQNYWREVAEAWEKMGLLRRVQEGRSYRLSLATRMGEVVGAKCPQCGTFVEAPKGILLDESPCPSCRKRVHFVILGSAGQR